VAAAVRGGEKASGYQQGKKRHEEFIRSHHDLPFVICPTFQIYPDKPDGGWKGQSGINGRFVHFPD
jgi:hypothetical protein